VIDVAIGVLTFAGSFVLKNTLQTIGCNPAIPQTVKELYATDSLRLAGIPDTTCSLLLVNRFVGEPVVSKKATIDSTASMTSHSRFWNRPEAAA